MSLKKKRVENLSRREEGKDVSRRERESVEKTKPGSKGENKVRIFEDKIGQKETSMDRTWIRMKDKQERKYKKIERTSQEML